MYDNFEELLKVTRERKIPIWKAVLEEESQLSESGESEIIMEFQRRFAIMETSVKKHWSIHSSQSRTLSPAFPRSSGDMQILARQ